MRTVMLMALLSVSTSTMAYAQAPATDGQCFPSSHVDKVVVQFNDGTAHRGSLLCLGPEELTLAEKQAISRFRLVNVLEIRKAADPVWDGALKGAAVGLVMLAFCSPHCSGEWIARTTLGYGVFGLALDAIDTNTSTIYRPFQGKRLAVGFRIGL